MRADARMGRNLRRCRSGAGCAARSAVLLALLTAPAAAQPPLIELLSANPRGQSAEGRSNAPALSADGSVAAFGSDALDLVNPARELLRNDVYRRVRAGAATHRVSVGIDGQANGPSQVGGFQPSISADGTVVAFSSTASNLVPGDEAGHTDIFVFDADGGTIERVSVGIDGEADGDSTFPRLSANGDLVVFESQATNLVAGDEEGHSDIFVFDRGSGITQRVSVASDGSAANADSHTPAISADGNVVAFVSAANNLAGVTGAIPQVFVHDLDSGETSMVSVSNGGVRGNRISFLPVLSADGNVVAFKSEASNLVAGDSNGVPDVFARDRAAGTTERVSVDDFGNQSNSLSGGPAISGDGRYVAFVSFSSSFDPNDGNGLSDVFVVDREGAPVLRGRIRRVSIAMPENGRPAGNAPDFPTSISADGRWVGFASAAENLVLNDLNNTTDAFVACNPFDSTGCAVPPTPTPTPVPETFACVGDCNLDNVVNINEIIRLTNMALGVSVCGNGVVQSCVAGDANGDCTITVEEIVRAVRNSLEGCTRFGSVPVEQLTEQCCG